MAASFALRPPNCALLSARERRPISTSKRTPKKTTPLASPPSLTPNPYLPPKKVLVPIAFGTEEMEAVILADVLRRAGADVLLASVEQGLQVEGSSRTMIEADAYVSDCADEVFDLVVLPGGMPGSARLRDSEILRKITANQAEKRRFYGAICAAPAVALKHWGLLRKKTITCHPAFMEKIPSFRRVKSNIQVSGELTTSRGPGTTFEFALSFVEQLFGDTVAEDVGGKLLMTSAGAHRKQEFNQVEWSFDRTPHMLVPFVNDCEGIEAVILVDILSRAKADVVVSSVDFINISHGDRILEILVPVANGCEETEAVVLVDILRRAKADVVVASVEKSTMVVASQQTRIIADKLIEEASDSTYDLVVLPGGVTGAESLHNSKVLKRLLKEQKAGGRMYGGICSSAAILQKQGLIMEKVTVSLPEVVSKPTGQVFNEADIVIDGKLITGRGLGTVLDFSLAIVHKLFGYGRARSVAEGIVFEYGKS